MSDRINPADVDRAFAGYVAFLRANRLVPADVRIGLDHGSKLYGLAFRLYHLDADSGGHGRPTIGDDYLGMTNREAWQELVTRRRVGFDVLTAAGFDAKWGES